MPYNQISHLIKSNSVNNMIEVKINNFLQGKTRQKVKKYKPQFIDSS